MTELEPMFDVTEATRFVIEKIGCTEEECNKYFGAELEYEAQHGILISVEEHLEQEERRKRGEEISESIVLDMDDMAKFIAENTGMSLDLVYKIMDVEEEYCDSIGLYVPEEEE